MAKSKGSAGRIPRGSRSYSDWIAGPYNEAIGWGAWVMTPDGKMLENAKIVSNPGASVMDFSYHEDAFQAIGERDGWGKATTYILRPSAVVLPGFAYGIWEADVGPSL